MKIWLNFKCLYLQKAEEECVNGDCVDREAGVGDVVRAEDDAEDGDEVEVELHSGVIEGRGEADGGEADHEDLAQDHHEISDLIHKESPDNVGGDQIEGVLRGLPEAWSHHGRHDEGVPVDVLDDLLQEEEASPEWPEDAPHAAVGGRGFVDLVIDVLHYEPKHLHHREDERPTSHGAQVIL